MKIGIDCRLWNESGVGRYIQNLVIELSKIDHKNEYVLFCLEKDYENVKSQVSNLKETSPLQGKHIRSENNWKIVVADIKWHSVAEQIGFPQIINRENVDLMHFTYFSVPIFYKRPYIMTMHDTTVSDMATGKASTLPGPVYKTKQIAYRLIVHQALKNAAKIIVPTKTVKAVLIKKELIPADKIEVTLEGAELSSKYQVASIKGSLKFESERINNQSSIVNSRYFLYVGNAYPHKNLERLTEAFCRFWSSQNDKEVELVLVGREDYFYKRLKEELEQKNQIQNIVFAGFVSDVELVQLYKNAQAVFVPSLAEGFGLPAVEAMSCGGLVAASDIPVLKEVCGDAALFFDPYKTQAISDIMTKIVSLTLKEREIYGKKAITQSKKFSWPDMAAKTLAIYESCTGV